MAEISPSPKPLAGKVVVVTGASSGIGRRTAQRFADAGADVVLVARRREALEEAARECEARGARALPFAADVTDEQAVHRLVSEAETRFGRLDVWVNAAAVSVFAPVEGTPLDVFRRVLDVNLVGPAICAQAAIPLMRKTGGGVIVNVASILGKSSIQHLGAYNAAKAGLASLSETLRIELAKDRIDVCTVNPPQTDTPFYRHAANYTGRAVRPPRPVYRADTTAEAIVACAKAPRREVTVGALAKAQDALHRVAPGLYEKVARPYGAEELFLDAPQAPTPGAVFEPMAAGATVDDGWKRGERPTAER